MESCGTRSSDLLAAAHRVARRHRAVDPSAWDAAWSQATGDAAPAWLTIDPELLLTAEAWVGTSTDQDGRDHLEAHPELLDPAAETAVEEALLTVEQPEADRYRQLVAQARTQGVDAAYRQLLTPDEHAGQGVDADGFQRQPEHPETAGSSDGGVLSRFRRWLGK